MDRQRGLQAEILVNLAVGMVTATLVLGAVLVAIQEAHTARLREVLAHGLSSQARSPLLSATGGQPGSAWWIVEPGGTVRALSSAAPELDPASNALVQQARAEGAGVLHAGPIWEPIRFAGPTASGDAIAVARIPPVTSPLLVLGLLLGDVLIFTGFGAYLLRRRLVLPLQRLAGTARSIADGAFGTRAIVDGPAEIVELGVAFNQMTDALEARTADLEKAVTELRRSNRHLSEAREGLDRAERLAAIGRLAAGVAHEVGNPMGALLAFLDLTGRDPGLSDASREYLSRAAGQGARVRVILRQLLDFSRPPRGTPVPVDLARICEETTDLVRAQRRYAGIALEVIAEAGTPEVLADPNTTAQIVLNLLLNAAEALRGGTQNPRVRILVRASVRALRAGEDRTTALARRGRPDAVECRVEDNGPGVAREDRERIFDPFFSSKEPGEGTGLGLSNALRFAQELGGSLELDPAETNTGATFVLCLPAVAEPRLPPLPNRARRSP